MLLNKKHDAKYRLNDSWNKVSSFIIISYSIVPLTLQDCHDEEGNEPDDEDNLDIEPESEEDVNHAPVPVKKALKNITKKKPADIIVSHCRALEDAGLA
jgi:hypothetical protein